jgi:hypothetical protein
VGGIIGKLSFERHVAISHSTVQRMIDAVAHRDGGAPRRYRTTYLGHGIALGSCDASVGDEGGASGPYEEWGDACVDRFAGPFAVAIWDEMRRRLVLARDPSGIRPLCFAFDGRGVVFASETTPLLQDPSVGREWQPEAIDAYLARGYVPAPFTIFRRISKLEAAHLLVVEGRRLSTRRYSDLLQGTCGRTAEREEVDRLESGLRTSVASLADSSAACVLTSGGVASTAILALLPRGGTAVTIGIDRDPADLDRVLRIAAHLGLRSEIDVAVIDPAEIMRQLAGYFDEPAADPALVSQYAVFAAARRYTGVALPGHAAAPVRDEGRRLFDEALRHRLYTRRFAAQVVGSVSVSRDAGVPGATLADSELAVADRTASAAGLRLRHPFLDRGVISSMGAARMDALRQLVGRHVPAPLLPAGDPAGSIPRWLSAAVRSLVPHILLGERFDTRGIFSRPALQAFWAEHQRGHHDHTHRLWSLLMLECWAREFIDGDAAAQPAEAAVLVRAA